MGALHTAYLAGSRSLGEPEDDGLHPNESLMGHLHTAVHDPDLGWEPSLEEVIDRQIDAEEMARAAFASAPQVFANRVSEMPPEWGRTIRDFVDSG